jgi:periplasmic protein TonB
MRLAHWCFGIIILITLLPDVTLSQDLVTLDSARAMIASKKLTEAKSYLDDVMSREGENVSLLRLQGEVKIAQGELSEAIEWYERAEDLDNCDTCHTDLDSIAILNLRLGRTDEAEEIAKKAKDRGSEFAEIVLAMIEHARGNDLINLQDVDGAIGRFQKALEIHEDTTGYAGLLRCYYLLRRKKDYLKLSESLIKRYPDFQTPKKYLCDYYVGAAKELEAAGMDSSALGVYALCIETDTARVGEMAMEIARVWLRRRDTARALEYYSNAFTDDRIATDAACEASSIYASRKMFSGAMTVLKNALNHYPADNAAWGQLAGYMLEVGPREDAIEADRIAAKLGNAKSSERLRMNYLASSPVNAGRFTWLQVDPFDVKWKNPERYAGRITPPDFIPVDEQPVPIFQANPDYPESARHSGMEGTVWVKLLVDRSGIVVKAVVMKSDNPVFNETSMEAGLKWRFKPAKLNGEAIAVWAAVPFRFKLNR